MPPKNVYHPTEWNRNLQSFIVGYRGDFFGETQKTKAVGTFCPPPPVI